jgi:hypothetical protein
VYSRAMSPTQWSLMAAGFQTELRRGDPDDPITGVLSLTNVYRNRVDLIVGLRGLDPA